MRRFILFLILFFGISFLFYIIVLIDFKPVTINISGYISLEDSDNSEGIRVEVVKPYHKIIFREPLQHYFTDSIGFYKLENVKVPMGALGEIFILWLDGRREKVPYLKLRISKKGYLPTDVLILKLRHTVNIPFLTLDKEGGRKPLNEVISEHGIKIIKNATKYRFCALHNYLWFFPKYYDLELRIPTDNERKDVKAKLRLIIEPLYTNFDEELNNSAQKLKRLIKVLIPEVSYEEVKAHGGENLANSLSNPSLIDKLNQILINSNIKHIRLTDIELVKRKAQ